VVIRVAEGQMAAMRIRFRRPLRALRPAAVTCAAAVFGLPYLGGTAWEQRTPEGHQLRQWRQTRRVGLCICAPLGT
jgi:hypothetical protein